MNSSSGDDTHGEHQTAARPSKLLGDPSNKQGAEFLSYGGGYLEKTGKEEEKGVDSIVIECAVNIALVFEDAIDPVKSRGELSSTSV